jgi:peptide chain release factor subunit 1
MNRNGTSMISLVVKPKDELSRISKLLADEFGTASNIKSRVNRLSVLSAITSTQQSTNEPIEKLQRDKQTNIYRCCFLLHYLGLKLYTRTPPNGLVVYCGTVVTDDGKEKKVSIDFQPFKPINTSLYLCGNKFHVEALKELLESDDPFGFIVMDGNGALFGIVQGSNREVRIMNDFFKLI